jgi:hypothetical protein
MEFSAMNAEEALSHIDASMKEAAELVLEVAR